MQICSVLGGFSEEESDDVRAALGKKKLDKLEVYKPQFINNAVNTKGIDIDVVEGVWSAMEEFAKYSFNLSHSVSYAITGYYGQWMKLHYPLQFWATTFTFGKKNQKEVARFMSEINQIGDITIEPVNINISGATTLSNVETNSLYWSLNSVKQCGDKAYNQIVDDRDKKGEYLSFDNFLTRHVYKGSKVNKASIENLIICGAFDDVEMSSSPVDRLDLISYYNHYKSSTKKKQENDISSPLWVEMSEKVVGLVGDTDWLMKQRDLCGFAFFDYEKLSYDNFVDSGITKPSDFILDGEGAVVDVGGYVKEWEVKNTRNGKKMAIGVLDHNYEEFKIVVWSDILNTFPELYEVGVGDILFFNGKLSDSTYSDTMDVVSYRYTEYKLIKGK